MSQQTVREHIIQDFITRLGVITVANGYNTNMGNKVIRAGRNITDADVPAVNVRPRSDVSTSLQSYGVTAITMEILLEGVMAYGATNPSVIAEEILGDLYACIMVPADTRYVPITGWDPQYVIAINYLSGGPDNYPSEEAKIIGSAALFEVVYEIQTGNPYVIGGIIEGE